MIFIVCQLCICIFSVFISAWLQYLAIFLTLRSLFSFSLLLYHYFLPKDTVGAFILLSYRLSTRLSSFPAIFSAQERQKDDGKFVAAYLRSKCTALLQHISTAVLKMFSSSGNATVNFFKVLDLPRQLLDVSPDVTVQCLPLTCCLIIQPEPILTDRWVAGSGCLPVHGPAPTSPKTHHHCNNTR